MGTLLLHTPAAQRGPASPSLALVPLPSQALQPERRPELVYLASLAPTGRRTMGQGLRCAAELLAPGSSPSSFPWAALTYAHTAALRTALAAKYAPATANKVLAAVRGVVKEAWRLGLIDAETLNRVRDVKRVQGSRLPAGREVPSGELVALLGACEAAGPSGVRDAALVALLYGVGLRRAEAAALDVAAFTGEGVEVLGKGNRERLA